LTRWRKLGANRPEPEGDKTAFLQFLPTAAGTTVVSSNAFERIFEALTTGKISFSPSLPPLLILTVLLAKAVPSGQLFYRIAK
jgi:hypothetical protein